MRSIKAVLGGVVAATLFGLSGLASASIVGDTVYVSHYYPDLNPGSNIDMGSQVVPTANFNYFGLYDVAVGGDYLTYTSNLRGSYFIDSTFNGPVLTDLNATFTNATIDASSTLAGFDASRLTFDANHIYANMHGLNLIGYLKINFETGSSAVPEPASIALMLAGLAGAAAARRKKSK
jgi:hypothetical protein